MTILETKRLYLRRLTLADAPFTLTLLNDPGYIQFIADRGVSTLAGARDYLANGPLAGYAQHGISLWLVVLKEGDVAVGMCGLIKRDSLDDVDIGYAFLTQFRGRGFAYEAAAATLTYGQNDLSLKRIVAITTTDNDRSIGLLEKLGLGYERMVRLTPGDIELKLFAVVLC